MKQKALSLLLVLVMVLTLCTGCGGSAMANDYAVKQEAAMEPEAPAAGDVMYGSNAATGSQVEVTDQKLIKRVSIDAETEDLEALLPLLADKIAELGGYVESQELYNGSMQSSYRRRSVNMTIRIPAQRLGEFTGQVEGMANVVTYSETTDDVTLRYVDTASRVKALEVEQERLMELLAKAETMADLLEIESRLTDVRYELESYASQLRALDNKVSYATVYLNLSQVRVYTEVEPQTVWQRIRSGFGENLRDIGEDLQDFLVWVTVYSPQLIFWAVVIAGAAVLLRRRFRRRKVKKAPNPTKLEDEKE